MEVAGEGRGGAAKSDCCAHTLFGEQHIHASANVEHTPCNERKGRTPSMRRGEQFWNRGGRRSGSAAACAEAATFWGERQTENVHGRCPRDVKRSNLRCMPAFTGRANWVACAVVLVVVFAATECHCAEDVRIVGTAVLPSNLAHGQGLVSKVVRVAENMFRSSWAQTRPESTSTATTLSAKKHSGVAGADRSGFVDVGRRSETPHKLAHGSAMRMPWNTCFQGRSDGRKPRNSGASDIPCAELYVEGGEGGQFGSLAGEEYGGSADGMGVNFQDKGYYKGVVCNGHGTYINSYKHNGRDRAPLAGGAGIAQGSRPDRFSAPARFGMGGRRFKTVPPAENLDLRHSATADTATLPPPPYTEAPRASVTPLVASAVRSRGDSTRVTQRVPPPVDADGHILPNVTRIDRFEVLRMLDKGTFGTVFMAWDCKWRQNVALKVVRKVTRYVEDAEFEVTILDKLAALDRKGRYCVKLYKYFHHHGHFCIVTELLGDSLYHSLKKLRQARKSVKLSAIWTVATQLCEALSFLRSVNLVHADLKTENILLSKADMSLDDDDLHIKLIDFGGATWQEDLHSKVIQTRHYRAPEVVLGLEWSYACDMWSVGCILLELYESRLTFDTRDTAQHLAMIRRLVGEIPPYLVRQIPREHSMERLFDAKGRLRWPELAQNAVEEEAVLRVARLEERVDPKLHDFTLLLRGMLQVDPAKRITPEQALRSRFLYRAPAGGSSV